MHRDVSRIAYYVSIKRGLVCITVHVHTHTLTNTDTRTHTLYIIYQTILPTNKV